MAYQQGKRGTGSERGQERDYHYSKQCLHCGQTYYKYVCCSMKRWELSKWCSISCRAKYLLSKGSIGRSFQLGRVPPHKGKGPKRPCPGCGELLLISHNLYHCDKPECIAIAKEIRYRKTGLALAAKSTPRGEGELILAPYLIERGWKTQYPVTVGGHTFRLDFAKPEVKLYVEVDGISHQVRKAKDAERNRLLIEDGWMGLRFWNSEVRDKLPEVLATVW